MTNEAHSDEILSPEVADKAMAILMCDGRDAHVTDHEEAIRLATARIRNTREHRALMTEIHDLAVRAEIRHPGILDRIGY